VGRGRKYSDEFKAEAVALAKSGQVPKVQVAKDLDIPEQTLYAWIAQTDRDGGKRTDGLTTDERKRMRELEKEVRVLREEREILKKAAAFFAEEEKRRSR
jgi:transposase